MHETPKRSLAKALTWKFLATLATVSLVFIVTGKAKLALSVGLIDVFLKLVLYYVHERAWSDVQWGTSIVPPTGAQYKKTLKKKKLEDDTTAHSVLEHFTLGRYKIEKQIAGMFGKKK